MLEIVKQNIDYLENNLTLDSDYKEELERLDEYEGNLSVLRFYSNTRITSIKINEQFERINHLRGWIKEELKRR